MKRRALASVVVLLAGCGRSPADVLAAGQSTVLQIAATDAGVFWLTNAAGNGNNSLRGVPVAGGSVRTYAEGSIIRFSADGDRLAWSSMDGIWTLRIGDAAPVQLSPDYYPFSPVFLRDQIYWASWGATWQTSQIRSASVTGGPITNWQDASHAIYYLAVDDDSFYWNDGSTAALWRARRSDGAVERLADSTAAPGPITLSDTYVFYWRGLNALPKAGGPTVAIAEGNVPFWTVNGGNLYVWHADYVWPEGDDDALPVEYSTIQSIDANTLKRGASLISRQTKLMNFAVHALHLYWVDTDGTIHK